MESEPELMQLTMVRAVNFPRGGYSHRLPIRVCAAQRGGDFEAPDLERRSY